MLLQCLVAENVVGAFSNVWLLQSFKTFFQEKITEFRGYQQVCPPLTQTLKTNCGISLSTLHIEKKRFFAAKVCEHSSVAALPREVCVWVISLGIAIHPCCFVELQHRCGRHDDVSLGQESTSQINAHTAQRAGPASVIT